MRRILIVLFVVLMAACLEETESCSDSSTSPSPTDDGFFDGDYGDDSAGSANFDGQCDDNRFIGKREHYYHAPSGVFNKRDATDCRTNHRAGLIRPRRSGDPDYLEGPRSPDTGPSGQYDCGNFASIWRGPTDTSIHVTAYCSQGCSLANIGAINEARSTCRLGANVMDQLGPRSADDFYRWCIPCGEVR